MLLLIGLEGTSFLMENQKNEFAFNAEFKDKGFAIDFIKNTDDYWKALVTKKTDGKGISCMNTTVSESPFKCDPDAAEAIVDALPPPYESAYSRPTDVDKWFHHQKNGCDSSGVQADTAVSCSSGGIRCKSGAAFPSSGCL